MAFKSSSTGSFHDLSSISGVPVKISDKFIAPKKVTLPMKLETSFQNHNPSEVLFMEYNFELEERVIQWSESYRESQQAYNRVETEKVADAIEQFSRSSPGGAMFQSDFAEEPGTNAEQVHPNQTQTKLKFPNENGDVGITQSVPDEQNASVVQKCEVTETNPFLQTVGTDILKPMQVPVQSQKEGGVTNKAQPGSFDLADFEQDQDPFDSAEMRVLNDMQELQKVLQHQDVPSVPASQTSPNTTQTGTVRQPIDSRGANADNSMGQTPPSAQTAVQPQITSIKEIDYPELDSLESVRSSNSAVGNASYGMPTGSLAPSSSAPVINKDLSYSQANSYVSGHGAPYPSHMTSFPSASNSFSNPTQSANPFMPSNPYAPTNTSNPFKNSNNPFASQAVGYNKQDDALSGALFPSSGKTVNGTSNGFHLNHGQQNQGASQNANSFGFLSHGSGYTVQLPEPTTSEKPAPQGLRSCRSTPDISALADNAPVHFPTSHTPPPNPQAQKSYLENERRKNTPYTNPFAQSLFPDTNPWGSYPVAAATKTAAGSSCLSNGRSQGGATGTSASSTSSLPDPYSSMSKESQTLVNKFTAMGFPRPQVARAVEKLGPDDKQIIDFLCLVNRMTEMGYVGDDVETALQLYENKEKKAEEYLKLLSQFKELGFSKDKVKDALVSSKLDQNKALDILTGNG